MPLSGIGTIVSRAGAPHADFRGEPAGLAAPVRVAPGALAGLVQAVLAAPDALVPVVLVVPDALVRVVLVAQDALVPVVLVAPDALVPDVAVIRGVPVVARAVFPVWRAGCGLAAAGSWALRGAAAARAVLIRAWWAPCGLAAADSRAPRVTAGRALPVHWDALAGQAADDLTPAGLARLPALSRARWALRLAVPAERLARLRLVLRLAVQVSRQAADALPRGRDAFPRALRGSPPWGRH